jgi:hypothetical protein
LVKTKTKTRTRQPQTLEQDKTTQDTARLNEEKEQKQDKTRQDQDKTRTRHGEAKTLQRPRQDKTREDKTRLDLDRIYPCKHPKSPYAFKGKVHAVAEREKIIIIVKIKKLKNNKMKRASEDKKDIVEHCATRGEDKT